MFTAQDSCKTQPTAEQVICFPYESGVLSLCGMSLHQQSFLICSYSTGLYYTFKFPSNGSLGVLFLILICTCREDGHLGQTINSLVNVLFS